MNPSIPPRHHLSALLVIPLMVIAAALPAAAQPWCSLTGHDWGTQWAVKGPCSKNRTIWYEATIETGNFTASAVHVVSLTLSGADAANGIFSFDSLQRETTMLVGDTIAPDGVLRQKVLFMPTEERPYSADVRLITDRGDTLHSTLSGMGSQSHGSITGIDFDSVGIEDPSPRKTLTLTALPMRPLTIRGFTILGPDAGSFALDHITTPFTLQPGESVTLTVEFRPERLGAYHAAISFVGDHSFCDDSSGTLEGYAKATSGVDIAKGVGGLTLETMRGSDDHLLIRYSLPAPADARIEVFNGIGERIAILLDDRAEEGAHAITWNAAGLPRGVYYCRIISGGAERVIPILLHR